MYIYPSFTHSRDNSEIENLYPKLTRVIVCEREREREREREKRISPSFGR